MSSALVSPPPLTPSDEAAYSRLQASRQQLETELSKVIIGQRDVVEQILLVLIAGGHALLTGAPGLAKTLLIKSIAESFQLQFQRIQFTPDLMPADITGTEILTETPEGRRLTFVRGPIFANLVLADEINRTPPKTQAALLEAMQEHQVTAAGVRHALPAPFFVLATQNPVEMEGTYPLPEAQLDRFLFNVFIDYLPEDDEVAVVSSTTSRSPQKISAVLNGDDLASFHGLVRQVPVADLVVRYAVRLASATRPGREQALDFVNEFVEWGAGTRAGQSLILGAKARALWQGRTHATIEDVKALAAPVLRHRILLNYRAEAENVTVEKLITRLLQSVKAPE
jgi:MoxR-like ATPase